MIAAALLHDIGHLLHNHGEDCAEDGVDDRHEQLGAAWLKKSFGPEVCEPVALHVPAKRYCCAVDADYFGKLSPASQLSLRLQGGPLSEAEAAEFQQHPFCADALRLRGWDEAAKIRGQVTPSLGHFLTIVEASLQP